mmetsp:Transcript_37594/g.89319  ORF Transcript_37594/g.89319 Transcript_37594/m.89319 type:complete len:183 (-) Transcript_37594:241-789(-)
MLKSAAQKLSWVVPDIILSRSTGLLSLRPAVCADQLQSPIGCFAASFHGSTAILHGGGDADPDAETINVTFVEKGVEKTIQVPLGQSLLEAAHSNDIELEGACEGSLACSTCHVIVKNQEYYDKLDEPVEDELDMLDLAFGLTETSRLGCQIVARKDLDGLKVEIPSATRNFAVDGFKPKPH